MKTQPGIYIVMVNNDFLPQGYQVHRSLDRFGEQDRVAYLAVMVKISNQLY
ncbi:MAG: hypothetical protein AAFY76_15825 [Cyanobacteria bacterium J06649_11]